MTASKNTLRLLTAFIALAILVAVTGWILAANGHEIGSSLATVAAGAAVGGAAVLAFKFPERFRRS